VQWGEPTFLDLVEHVADWSRDAPILVVCMARLELLDKRPGWGGGKFNSTSVLLEPLSENDSAQLIVNLLGRAELAPAVRARAWLRLRRAIRSSSRRCSPCLSTTASSNEATAAGSPPVT
jgi:predicted ATPase